MKSKLLILLVASILCAGCEQAAQKAANKTLDSLNEAAKVDSFSRAKYHESAAEHAQKMADSVITKAMLDTAGMYKAPVKVLKAKMVSEEYSSYRNVYLSFKNVSGKTITAIKFSWYGTNAFNEPAELGNPVENGFGGGFTDHELGAGKTSNGTWNIMSRDGKKIKVAWPTEVSFADGTNWKLNNK